MKKSLTRALLNYIVANLLIVIIFIVLIHNHQNGSNFKSEYFILILQISMIILQFSICGVKTKNTKISNIFPFYNDEFIIKGLDDFYVEKLRKNFQIKSYTTNNNIVNIILNTGFTYRSWGERVEIEIKTVDNISEISLVSCPKFFFKIADFGKNFENVQIIKNIFQNSINIQNQKVAHLNSFWPLLSGILILMGSIFEIKHIPFDAGSILIYLGIFSLVVFIVQFFKKSF